MARKEYKIVVHEEWWIPEEDEEEAFQRIYRELRRKMSRREVGHIVEVRSQEKE